MVVAYRGFSDSDGYHTEYGIKLDAEQIIKYTLEHPLLDPTTCFLLGRGLGGAVATYALTTPPGKQIRGFICDQTFSSLIDQIDNTFPRLKHIIRIV